jgi:predicted metal-dependent hydrolase
MNDKEKLEIMSATVKPIIDLLQTRMNKRVEILTTLSTNNLDSIPESVRKMREEECAKIRAVIQEQSDLIEIIKVLYPNG